MFYSMTKHPNPVITTGICRLRILHEDERIPHSLGFYTTPFFIIIIIIIFYETFLCFLAIHLHDNCILGVWKRKLLKMGFKVHVFENANTIIMEILENFRPHVHTFYMFSQ